MEKIIKSHSNPYKLFTVQEYWVVENGNLVYREVLERVDAAAILVARDDKILLIKQWRTAAGQELWEIPAGKVEPGEDPQQTAVRELLEECNLEVTGVVEKICSAYASPGYTTEKLHLYFTQEVQEKQGQPDPDERIEMAWFSLPEVKQMIAAGEIADMKTIAAIHWLYV